MLNDIWLFIASDNPSIADAFIDFIYNKCELLSESPNIGRKRDEILIGLRCLVVKKYIIFYRIKKNSLEIVRILNGYRDIDSLF